VRNPFNESKRYEDFVIHPSFSHEEHTDVVLVMEKRNRWGKLLSRDYERTRWRDVDEVADVVEEGFGDLRDATVGKTISRKKGLYVVTKFKCVQEKGSYYKLFYFTEAYGRKIGVIV